MTNQHATEPKITEKPAELAIIIRDIREMMARNRLVEGLVDRSSEANHALVEKIVHKQNLTRLAQKIEHLHPADIAVILEALPVDERMAIWSLVHADQDGDVLLEVSDAVRMSLLAAMDREEMLNAANTLDTDELADLAPDLPEQVMQEVFTTLPLAERERLRFALSYAEDTVGALMDFDLVTVRADVRIEVVLRYLRRMEDLPDHTDKLFVVNREGGFVGVIYLKNLLLSDPALAVHAAMAKEVVRFHPEDKARTTADAFERYDLVSAPVVDEHNRLIGRVTINAV